MVCFQIPFSYQLYLWSPQLSLCTSPTVCTWYRVGSLKIQPSRECYSEGRKQHQLETPMVSYNMRSNLLIIGILWGIFFFLSYLFTSSVLIIMCGIYSIVERFMSQILISAAGHASVLISKWRCVLCGHCFMWSQSSASQDCIPEAREKEQPCRSSRSWNRGQSAWGKGVCYGLLSHGT